MVEACGTGMAEAERRHLSETLPSNDSEGQERQHSNSEHQLLLQRPWFDSQHPQTVGAQPSVTPVPGNWSPLQASVGTRCGHDA